MRLKQYIKEKANLNSKVLYHVTNFESTQNILKHNYFRTSINTETGKRGLSTTTDKRYIWGQKEIRFILNTKKVKAKYKLLIVEPLKGIDDESEVLILKDGAITDANKYIDRIDISNNTPKKLIEQLQAYKKEYNIEIAKWK